MSDIMTDIIEAVTNLFVNRDDVYPRQLDGLNEYKVIKEKIDKELIVNHLKGAITIGSFQIPA